MDSLTRSVDSPMAEWTWRVSAVRSWVRSSASRSPRMRFRFSSRPITIRAGDRLTLDYVTYPADAPEPTRMVYRRVASFE